MGKGAYPQDAVRKKDSKSEPILLYLENSEDRGHGDKKGDERSEVP